MRKQTIQNLLIEIYDSAPEAESIAVEKNIQNLTAQELHMIRIVDVRGQSGLIAIARSLRLDTSLTAGYLCSLEVRGYVKQKEGKFSLTEEGEKVLAEYKDMIRNGVEELFAHMSDDEVDTVIKGMELLKECFTSIIGDCGAAACQKPDGTIEK